MLRTRDRYAIVLAKFARRDQDRTDVARSDQTATIVRTRLRSLRRTLGWSLDDLAERSHLSASTISRIETGKRALSLDALVALADALDIAVSTLVEVDEDVDIIVRSTPTTMWPGVTIWPLSRPTSSIAAMKMRLEPSAERPQPRLHPGHDWLFVLTGQLELIIGERRVIVNTGESAEFSTMTPHAIRAIDTPATLLLVSDRDGQRTHLQHPHDR